MKNLYVLLFTLTLPFLSFAQNDFRQGYIINLQGDTLLGEVNFKGDVKNARECVFRTHAGAEAITYQPNQLTGYGIKGERVYEAKSAQIVTREYTLEDKFVEVPVSGNGPVNFMQVLVKGPVSLFFMKDVNAETHYFIQQGNQPLKELVYLQVNRKDPKTSSKYAYSYKLYANVLKVAFNDCPKIAGKIEKAEFKTNQLTVLFQEYNACVAPGQPMAVQEKRKSIVTFGALAGLSFSNLTIAIENHYLGAGEFTSKASPTGGIFIDFTLPKINQKLSLNNAIYFTQRNYTANYVYTHSDLYKGDYNVTYNFKLVRLETLLRYTAPTKKITPFLQAGLSNSLMFSGEENITWVKYYLDYPGENKKEEDYLTPIFRNHQLGFVGGAGLKYNLSNGTQLFLQANYEFNTGFTKGIGVSSNSHNAAVVVGIGF